MGKSKTFPPWASRFLTIRSKEEHILIILSQHQKREKKGDGIWCKKKSDAKRV